MVTRIYTWRPDSHVLAIGLLMRQPIEAGTHDVRSARGKRRQDDRGKSVEWVLGGVSYSVENGSDGGTEPWADKA